MLRLTAVYLIWCVDGEKPKDCGKGQRLCNLFTLAFAAETIALDAALTIAILSLFNSCTCINGHEIQLSLNCYGESRGGGVLVRVHLLQKPIVHSGFVTWGVHD